MRRRPADYHHGDLRKALIHQTIKLVDRDGLPALTLGKLAKCLGVSPPAVYHHFAGKTELIVAATGQAFAELDRDLADVAVSKRSSSSADLLEELAVTYVRFAVERRGEFRLIYGAHVADLELSSYPEVAIPGRSTKKRIREAVMAALPNTPGEECFAIIWAQLVGIASLMNERELGPEVGIEKATPLVRRAVRSHLAGLGAIRAA